MALVGRVSWLGRTVFLMTSAFPEPPTRKKLRVGHRSERGGINAVRTLLERHGMVVDEVAGRSDYGRDLNVDLTRGLEVTGGIIGVQVKGWHLLFQEWRMGHPRDAGRLGVLALLDRPDHWHGPRSGCRHHPLAQPHSPRQEPSDAGRQL